jgi:PAS domain S-box-containing protein
LESGWIDRIPVAVFTHDISVLIERVRDLLREHSVFKLRIILEQQPELLRELMGQVRTIEANGEALRLIGAAGPEEALGPLSRLLPPEADLVFLDMILGLTADVSDFDAEIPLRTLDGKLRDVEVRARIIEGPTGSPLLITCVFDVTPRQEAMRRLAAESEDLSVAAWQTDAEGSMTHPQPAWQAFTGQSFEESRIASWVQVTHPDDREQLERLWERAYALRALFVARCRVWRASYASYRRGVVHGIPVIKEDGEVNRWHWIAIDIDDRLRAAELERSNRDLEQFAFVAAHDLKAPLRTLTMSCDLLKDRHGDSLDASGSKLISMTRDAAATLQAMISGLLRYARLEAMALELEPVGLGDVLRCALDLLSAETEEAQAEVAADPLPEVLGDPNLLLQLFTNLISNALRYRGNAPARVSVSARPAKGRFWRVTVRDQGVGIPSEATERIFELFERAGAPTTAAGTGLGLAICRRLVERHGGTIWAESSEEEGTSLHFTLRSA